jgi:ABC-type glutathione transport system ATPase component
MFIAHDLPVVRDFADHVMVMEKGKVVEIGTVRSTFETPQQPYTRRLLAAGLDPDPEVQKARRLALRERAGTCGLSGGGATKEDRRAVYNQSELSVLTRIKRRHPKDIEWPVEFLQVAGAGCSCRSARERHREPSTHAVLSMRLHFCEGHMQRTCLVERRICDHQPEVPGARRICWRSTARQHG